MLSLIKVCWKYDESTPKIACYVEIQQNLLISAQLNDNKYCLLLVLPKHILILNNIHWKLVCVQSNWIEWNEYKFFLIFIFKNRHRNTSIKKINNQPRSIFAFVLTVRETSRVRKIEKEEPNKYIRKSDWDYFQLFFFSSHFVIDSNNI